MDAKELLKSYRVNKAKVSMAELDVEGLERLLNSQVPIETEDEVIEALSLKPSTLSGMPKGLSETSIVESVALSYRKDIRSLSQNDIKGIIAKSNDIIFFVKYQVRMVEEVLLPCLTDKEEFIMRRLYINEYSWTEIVGMYAKEFGFRNEQTLKHIRKYALSKMQKIIDSKIA